MAVKEKQLMIGVSKVNLFLMSKNENHVVMTNKANATIYSSKRSANRDLEIFKRKGGTGAHILDMRKTRNRKGQ